MTLSLALNLLSAKPLVAWTSIIFLLKQGSRLWELRSSEGNVLAVSSTRYLHMHLAQVQWLQADQDLVCCGEQQGAKTKWEEW